jgi:2,4-dienoyl-CoA reductase-like NADH-dependent reductase (Old Yellow Enzyme family)
MLANSLSLRDHALRNRLVLTAVTTNLAAPEGGVTEDLLGYYDQRTRDVGLASHQ